MTVVFKFGEFTIEKHPPVIEGAGQYSVYGSGGEVVRGNRSSLWDAAVEMDKYNLTGGYKKWETVEGLVKSKTFYHGMDIDPELRSIIGELNRNGLVTLGSCAGHGEPGFITFEKKVLTSKDRSIIKGILEDKDIKIQNFGNALGSTQYSIVHFTGIDGSVGKIPFWLR